MEGDSGKEGVWGEGWEDGGLGNGPLGGGSSKRKIPLVKGRFWRRGCNEEKDLGEGSGRRWVPGGRIVSPTSGNLA